MIDAVTNPKAQTSNAYSRVHWYPYYAGYSSAFVDSVLKVIPPKLGLPVLDPWNGSGTTTAVCALSGHRSIGFDLNPVMVIVAKARLLQPNVAGSLVSLVEALVAHAEGHPVFIEDDPLRTWFSDSGASVVRSCERAVQHLLIENSPGLDLTTQSGLSRVSSLAAFFYVLLFRAVRTLLPGLETTNPTWLRASTAGLRRTRVSYHSLRIRLLHELSNTALRHDFLNTRGVEYVHADVDLADSRTLPLKDHSVGSIITSPPYCTRIDYAVATRVELAILGNSIRSFELLRRTLIGTTLSPSTNIATLSPPLLSKLLSAIRRHPSKASSTYYVRTYEDYFRGLHRSLAEVARVLCPSGSAAIVVQDSLYKDIHVDLPLITNQLCSDNGLTLTQRHDFPCRVSMRRIHQHAKRYRKNWQPTESVLIFTKEG